MLVFSTRRFVLTYLAHLRIQFQEVEARNNDFGPQVWTPCFSFFHISYLRRTRWHPGITATSQEGVDDVLYTRANL